MNYISQSNVRSLLGWKVVKMNERKTNPSDTSQWRTAMPSDCSHNKTSLPSCKSLPPHLLQLSDLHSWQLCSPQRVKQSIQTPFGCESTSKHYLNSKPMHLMQYMCIYFWFQLVCQSWCLLGVYSADITVWKQNKMKWILWDGIL